MKKNVIIMSIVILAVGTTAFSFINKENAVKIEYQVVSSNAADSNVKYADVNFFNVNKLPVKRMVRYMVQPKHNRKTTLEKLRSAKLINDFIPNYASSWITDYISVEILVVSDKGEESAFGVNEVLNEEQRALFSTLNSVSEVFVHVKYRRQNGVNNALEYREVKLGMEVEPEKRANYVGGYEEMINYLKDNSKDEVTFSKEIDMLSVEFVVNKNGKIEQVQLVQTSENNEVDQLIVDLIEGMPKWEAAKSFEGVAVQQKFKLDIGQMIGC